MERRLQRNEQGYKNLMALAKILEAFASDVLEFEVEDTYLDYGQDWQWTTIIVYNTEKKDSVLGSYQLLNPRQWKEVVNATTAEELVEIAKGFTF